MNAVTVALVMVFATVALISASVTYMALEAASPARRRMRDLLRGRDKADEQAAAGPESSLVVQRVKTFVPKSAKDMSKLQKRMVRGGFIKPSHLAIYLVLEICLPVIGFVASAYFLGIAGRGMVFAIMAAILGYLAPSLVLERYIRQRQKEIQNGLPDALDLMIVSIEAGLAIDQAIMKCAEELYLAYPALAEELRYVNIECRAGKPRIEAFKNLDARTKNDDVRALVAMMVQTDRFGTSISQALRTFADVTRTKRRQRAEERAAQVGVKMVFPLVLFLFPALYVVILGAAVIQIFRAFLG